MPDRLEALIHHITTLCDPDDLGRTKIAKIIWLSDVEYFRSTGKTITESDDYVKDDHGPRHALLYDALENLKRTNKIAERKNPTPVGVRSEYISLAKPNVDGFSADQIAIIDRIAAKITRLSAKQASDLTHDELWTAAYLNERMPVAAAAPVAGSVTPDIIAWAEGVHNEYSATG
jgi:uncharacterized phage-associated protein